MLLTARDEPQRAKLLKDNELPKTPASHKERVDPNRLNPITDSDDPMRAKALSARDDPTFAKSKTETAARTRPQDMIDMDAPNRE